MFGDAVRVRCAQETLAVAGGAGYGAVLSAQGGVVAGSKGAGRGAVLGAVWGCESDCLGAVQGAVWCAQGTLELLVLVWQCSQGSGQGAVEHVPCHLGSMPV